MEDLQLGGQAYWLVTRGKDEDEGSTGGTMGRHFDQPVVNTQYVESLDDAIRRVEAAGGKKVHGPNEVPEVGMHAYCSDPEGTLFGLMEPKKS